MTDLLCVVAGEASGDLHAAAMLHALKDIRPGLHAFGIGGEKMRAEGFESLYDTGEMAVVGFSEVLRKLTFFHRAYRRVVGEVLKRRPKALVLVDFPDFNFRVGRAVHAQCPDIPIVYFISPQVWAWRKGRLRTMKTFVRKALVIFPFEEAFYRRAGIEALYVGHPMAKSFSRPLEKISCRNAMRLDPSAKTVLFLPGSRPVEVARHLPPLSDAVLVLHRKHPTWQILISEAPALPKGFIARRVPGPLRSSVQIRREGMELLLSASDAAVVSSGTATLQTALAGVPMVVVYRLSWMSYALARLFVKIKYAAMVNILLKKPCVPELIQGACTGERIAREVEKLILDSQVSTAMKNDFSELRGLLGDKDAAREAAAAILDILRHGNPANSQA